MSTDQYNIFFQAGNNAYINSLPPIQPTLLNSQRELTRNITLSVKADGENNVSFKRRRSLSGIRAIG